MKKSSNNFILRVELIGIAFIVFLGSALHFTFELSSNNPIVGVFSAVNESVWEHLKLSFWPAITYTIIEHKYLKKMVGNFFPAKTVGIYLMPLAIISFFYLYRVFLEENLALDILIFIAAVVLGQLTSYKLTTFKRAYTRFVTIAIIALVLLASLFIIFTFYPPHLPIFMDPISGGYGITG